jgi:hypothetical protein
MQEVSAVISSFSRCSGWWEFNSGGQQFVSGLFGRTSLDAKAPGLSRGFASFLSCLS